MTQFYIKDKKSGKFIQRNGRPITYGTPAKFDSFQGAWLWTLNQKDPGAYLIVRVVEGKT